ncbi:MAG: type II toxin-antitoxin system Phd/YefM family antitoxin [Proteobacteria bacterium]|nr:type II toxin-antitoxin system Phd/YefM family antitoxin [Pseudomonadota bacterium]
MDQIIIHQAKTHLSRLIAEGEEVIIAKYGEPVARLVPIRPKTEFRKPGSAKDRFDIPDSFFDPLPDSIMNKFYK